MSSSRLSDLVVHACEQGLYEDWVATQLMKEGVPFTREELNAEFSAYDPDPSDFQ